MHLTTAVFWGPFILLGVRPEAEEIYSTVYEDL